MRPYLSQERLLRLLNLHDPAASTSCGHLREGLYGLSLLGNRSAGGELLLRHHQARICANHRPAEDFLGGGVSALRRERRSTTLGVLLRLINGTGTSQLR